MLLTVSKKANSALANLVKLVGCTLLASLCANAVADISISTTIRPLHFIALAIVGDRGEVTALIDSKSSPHHFNLTPSDRLELVKSDLIVWVGPELESQLSNSLSKMAGADRIIMATKLSGLISHKVGDGNQIDAHIWLDTRNAALIATEIANLAKQIDPENSGFYQTNLSKFQLDLDRATDHISQLFNPTNVKTFAVYHNGFQYFEKQFGLSHQLEFVRDPEVPPTIAQIMNTRRKVTEIEPHCLFSEPDANSELIRTMLSDYQPNNSIEEVTIDLLGNGIAESPSAYINLITHVADEFSNCLNIDAAKNANNR